MATISNSSFKIQASEVETSVGIVPEKGAILFDLNLDYHVIGDGSNWVRVNVIPYSDPFWVDMLGPLIGQRLDSAATRYSHSPFNGAIAYANNARYTEEVIAQENELIHEWILGTNGRPHLHWKQQSADIPNWLFGWKLHNNGEADAIETDYSNFTFSVLESHAFTYVSGVLNQISAFPDIDLSTAKLSDLLTIVFFRDTLNTSGEFAGADPSALTEYATNLDTHIQIDAPGSLQPFIK